jgi:hypothetical protein
MNLIFINEIGSDYKGQKQYEFIFSDHDEIEVEGWYTIPASLSIESLSPEIESVQLVGLLKNTDLILELIQNSDYFGVIDAVDGVISLGWEKFDNESVNERLTFKFGDTLDVVTKKLKKRNFQLINEELKIKI